jgi:hypothetical protein
MEVTKWLKPSISVSRIGEQFAALDVSSKLNVSIQLVRQ